MDDSKRRSESIILGYSKFQKHFIDKKAALNKPFSGFLMKNNSTATLGVFSNKSELDQVNSIINSSLLTFDRGRN